MINYVVAIAKNPISKTFVYYPRISLSGTMGLKDVVTEIEKRSTVSSADVKAVIDALQFEVKEALSDGNTVRLGDLGSFHTTISSKGEDERANLTVRHIRSLRVRFTPSSTLQSEFSNVGSASSKVKLQRIVKTQTE